MLEHRPRWLPPRDVLRRFYGSTAAYPYYRLQLTEYICRLLPEAGAYSLLDVGAGDGSLGAVVRTFRPETRVVGVETFIREHVRPGFPLARFDGRHLPFADATFDAALLSNVLHHAEDQAALLREVCRVTRERVIIKDHLARSALDRWQLALLDVMGNLRFGASTTGRYLSDREWAEMFSTVRPRSVTRYDSLSFRTGLLERIFGNRLEIMFVVTPQPRSERQ